MIVGRKLIDDPAQRGSKVDERNPVPSPAEIQSIHFEQDIAEKNVIRNRHFIGSREAFPIDSGAPGRRNSEINIDHGLFSPGSSDPPTEIIVIRNGQKQISPMPRSLPCSSGPWDDSPRYAEIHDTDAPALPDRSTLHSSRHAGMQLNIDAMDETIQG